MAHEWKDKVVFITGAASGIGAETVKLLMEECVKHVAILDVAKEKGEVLEKELNSKYGNGKVKFYHGDVTKEDDLSNVFEAVVRSHGYVDVVINNAGILNDSKEVFKKEIEINFTASINGTLKALDLMRKDQDGRGGTIINVGSVAGLVRLCNVPIYGSTKAGILFFSNIMGMNELFSRTGVRVITVCFGATGTDILTEKKWGFIDENLEKLTKELLETDHVRQRLDSAAKGLVDAYKQGESASTWFVSEDKPAKDITEGINKSAEIIRQWIA